METRRIIQYDSSINRYVCGDCGGAFDTMEAAEAHFESECD